MRYTPEFEWQADCWTHNCFRFLELFIGRKIGVRPEMSAGLVEIDGRAQQVFKFHTLEAFLQYLEYSLRAWCFRIPVKIWIPLLRTPDGMLFPASPYLFAIAVDATGDGTPATIGATKTWTHVAASGSVMVVMGLATASVTSVNADFNGTAMTEPVAAVTPFATDTLHLYYLLTPASGSHTVTLTPGLSTNLLGWSVTYSGANTSSIGGTTSGSPAGASFDISIAGATAASSWITAGVTTNGSNGAGANTADRSGANQLMYDSNAIAVGDKITVTRTGGTISGYIGFEIKIAAAATKLFTLLGTGT